MKVNTTTPVVSIGIDAAVVASHQIAIRGEVREDFKTAPTLAGLTKLTERLEPYAGSLVVAEPTAGTWLPLAHAVSAAGCEIGFGANRDSARLRKAITGASKTDVIDADMLAHCSQVLGVGPAAIPPPGQIALRRAIRRRHVCTVDAHRVECRLWALAAWAFPDLWRATGGHVVAQPLLTRWPHLERLSRARLSSITEIVAAHSRDSHPEQRATRIRDAAAGWATLWTGRLDLDGLGWELAQMLADINTADQRHHGATDQALELWQHHWPDDVLTSIPGLGPICASTIRGWWGDATHLETAKAATAHAGLNPSKDHPFLSVIGLLLGGESARRLVELVAAEDRQVRVLAHALNELPSLGWAISSYVPVDAYCEILEAHADDGADDDLDAALDDAWNASPILGALAARVGALGAGDDDLRAIAEERARLVALAWKHHLNEAYEASVPIVLAQVDGITHDATTGTGAPSGRSFFSMNSSRQANVADDETLAGIEHGLPAVRRWYSERFVSSGARGTTNRHGVLHGRELRYDTRINSTKSFVLLLAVWEWANQQLAEEAQRRKDARYAEHEGSDGVDENGWRLDRRGFSTTRERLRRLALAERAFRGDRGRFGSLSELRLNLAALSLIPAGHPIEILLGNNSWWASECSEAGWIFSIGGEQDSTYYFNGAAMPVSGPPGDGWRSTDDGNWSGDCYW